MKIRTILLCCALFLLLLQTIASPAEIRVKIEYPADGDTIYLSTDLLVIKGKAFVKGVDQPLVDLILVIDSSGSTARPSGVDVNGNGVIGRRVNEIMVFGVLIGSKITDPGDSVLAAEVQAAKNLLYQLDPETTRVGVVNFSGDFLPGTGYDGNRTFQANPLTPDAYLAQPLTSDFGSVSRALDQIYISGAYGGTNISEGLRVAISEISGTRRSFSPSKHDTRKFVLLLSDGVPTFPVGSASVSDPEDKSLAISAAKIADIASIRISTFALGIDSFEDPYTLREIARVSKGKYTPLINPGDIVDALPRTSFIDMDFVDVVNSTYVQRADQIVLNPAGGFIASVPVKDGVNKISATAHATDGRRAGDAITINFKKVDKQENLRELVLTKDDELSLELEKKNREKLKLDVERAHKKALELELERARKRNKELDEKIAEQQKQLEQKSKKEGGKGDKPKQRKEKLELELDIKDK
jgi:hypothetical protein